MTERQIETLSEGEFVGWSREVNREGFNGLVGAYYYQADDPANLKVAFKAGKDHLNGGGTVHGGCLLTLADTSMFIFSLPHLKDGGAVTVQLDAQSQTALDAMKTRTMSNPQAQPLTGAELGKVNNGQE